MKSTVTVSSIKYIYVLYTGGESKNFWWDYGQRWEQQEYYCNYKEDKANNIEKSGKNAIKVIPKHYPKIYWYDIWKGKFKKVEVARREKAKKKKYVDHVS